MTPQHRWPDGPDEVSAELRRALDEASLRGPDDMTLRRGLERGRRAGAAAARARRGFWFAGGVATTAALVLAGSFWLWPRRDGAGVERAPEGPAKSESLIPPGARRLTLEGGVEAVLGRSSVMRLEDGAPRIEGGEVRFSVPHRQPGHPFVVRAEGYRVVVVGTRFGIAVDGKADGKAEGQGGRRRRRRGDRRGLGRGHPAPAGAADARRELAQPRGRRGGPAGPAAVEPAPAPSAPAPVISPPPTPSRSLRHAGKHAAARTLGARLAGRDRDSQRTRREPGRSADRRIDGRPRGAGLGRRAPRAAALSRAGAGDRPVGRERLLRDREGPEREAGPAGQRRGRLAPLPAGLPRRDPARRGGRVDHRDARPHRRHRRGAVGGERLLAPAAPTASGAPRSRGWPAISTGRAATAATPLAAYQITLGASRPRDAVEAATFHRAACLVHLGDAAGADAARAYLRTYPSGKFRGEATALAGGGSALAPVGSR